MKPIHILLLAYLLLGASIYDDYAVHWDEIPNQRFSKYLVAYVLEVFMPSREEPLVQHTINYHFIEHGPLVELAFGFIQKYGGYIDRKEIILMRHLGTFFLFLVGGIFFARLLHSVFADDMSTCIGTLLYILHPRIFAHSFFNTTDISLLTFFTVSLLTADMFFKHPSFKTMAAHSLITAMAINIRLAALTIPLATMILVCSVIAFKKEKRMMHVCLAVAYLILIAILTFMMWPFLWDDPGFFIRSFNDSANNHRPAQGWDYNFIWFFFTTPLVISALFILGMYQLFRHGPKLKKRLKDGEVTEYMAFLYLAIALYAPIYFGTFLKNSWRHHFFIYSSVILICIGGFAKARIMLCGWNPKRAQTILALAILISYLPVLAFMVTYHPHQHIYVNEISAQWVKDTLGQGSLDYWGLSYKPAIDHVLMMREGKLKIMFATIPGEMNLLLLEPDMRARVNATDSDDFDYYITTNQRIPLLVQTNGKKIYSLRYGDLEYMQAYEIVKKGAYQPSI